MEMVMVMSMWVRMSMLMLVMLMLKQMIQMGSVSSCWCFTIRGRGRSKIQTPIKRDWGKLPTCEEASNLSVSGGSHVYQRPSNIIERYQHNITTKSLKSSRAALGQHHRVTNVYGFVFHMC